MDPQRLLQTWFGKEQERRYLYSVLHGKERNTFAFKHERFWYLGV